MLSVHSLVRYSLLFALSLFVACTSQETKKEAKLSEKQPNPIAQKATPPAPVAVSDTPTVEKPARPTPSQKKRPARKLKPTQMPQPATEAQAWQAPTREQLRSLLPKPQVFIFNSKVPRKLIAKQGTLIEVPPNAFKDKKTGEIYEGKVRLEVEEFYTPGQFILASLATQSENQLLESAGMLNLKALDEAGNELALVEDKALLLGFPKSNSQRLSTEDGLRMFNSTHGDDWALNEPIGEESTVGTGLSDSEFNALLPSQRTRLRRGEALSWENLRETSRTREAYLGFVKEGESFIFLNSNIPDSSSLKTIFYQKQKELDLPEGYQLPGFPSQKYSYRRFESRAGLFNLYATVELRYRVKRDTLEFEYDAFKKGTQITPYAATEKYALKPVTHKINLKWGIPLLADYSFLRDYEFEHISATEQQHNDLKVKPGRIISKWEEGNYEGPHVYMQYIPIFQKDFGKDRPRTPNFLSRKDIKYLKKAEKKKDDILLSPSYDLLYPNKKIAKSYFKAMKGQHKKKLSWTVYTKTFIAEYVVIDADTTPVQKALQEARIAYVYASVNSLGLINCDRFTRDEFERMAKHNVALSTETISTPVLHFEDINSLIRPSQRTQKEYIFFNLPNLAVNLIDIKYNPKDNIFMLGKLKTTAHQLQDAQKKVKYQEVSREEITQVLAEL